MEPWHAEAQSDLVDVIEEGKIVRVPESYAKKEGLPILRKTIIKKQPIKKRKDEEEARITFEDLRKPLNWKKSQVVAELVENFHWLITKKRKECNLTRRQLAKAIEESENNIKLIENGILPRNDFVILNKIQSVLNINLRRDKKDFSQSPRSLIIDEKEKAGTSKQDKLEKKDSSDKEALAGSDIEIIE